MWYVRPAFAQSDQSLCLSLEYSMTVKLLSEDNLEYLNLKGGCTGSSESTLVKMQHCWKSHYLILLVQCAHNFLFNLLYPIMKTVLIQISWLLLKPADQDQHFFSHTMNLYYIWNYLTLCPLGNLSCFFVVCWFFFKINFFEKFFQQYHLSVKQIGSRSGLMFCRVWSGSNLFEKVISR